MFDNIIKFFKKYYLLILFILGLLILYFRSAHNILFPNIYAEDGKWLANIWNRGTLWTILNARNDYLTFWLIIELKISDVICNLIYGGNIAYIPKTIYFVSLMSYTIIAMIPVLFLKKRLSKFAQLFLFFMILLLPMGNTSNEVLGRILQGHFFMWFIAFCLLIYRYDNKIEKKINTLFVDILLSTIVCTNPVVLIEIVVYFIIELFEIYKKNGNNIRNLNIKKILNDKYIKQLLCFGLAIMMIGIFMVIKTINYKDLEVHNLPNYKNTIEFFVRSFLYPYIFPFYKNLNNIIGIILLLFMLTIYFIAYKKISEKNKKIYILSIVSTISIAVITFITRAYLTASLLGYSDNNIPDRYFMIMNISNLITPAIIISEFNKTKFTEYFCYIFLAYIACIYINYCEYIFIFDKNECLAITDITFDERLKNAKYDEKRKVYDVDIDPWWKIEIPEYKYQKYKEDMNYE